MKIGIDARILELSGGSGVLVYWRHVLRELLPLAAERSCCIYLYTDNPAWSPAEAGVSQVDGKTVCVTRLVRRRAGWYDVWLPLRMRRDGIDVAWLPTARVPRVKPCAIALTVFDMCFVQAPECYEPGDLQTLRGLLPHIRRADLVLAISASTARSLYTSVGVDATRIVVTPLAGGTGAGPATEDAPEPSASRGFDGKYFLTVSRLDGKKNLERVIEAFARARREDGLAERLLMVGPKDGPTAPLAALIAAHDLAGCVDLLPFVTDARLDALYRRATALVFPSICEGFGLPLLEAMARGCPVITSDRSAMPEVAGDAACYVDPLSVDSIAGAMTRVASDPAYRAGLQRAGFARCSSFSWRRSAEITLEALTNLGETSARDRARGAPSSVRAGTGARHSGGDA